MKLHASLWCLLWWSAATALWPQSARSQISEDEVLALLANNDLAEARERVSAARRSFPNSSMAAYFHALLEHNADAAATHYQEFTRKFSDSPYWDRALYRLGQYYFARGSYVRARQYYLQLAQTRPNSPLATQASYYAAKSLLIAGDATGAETELQQVAAASPGTWMARFAHEDLAQIETTVTTLPSPIPASTAPPPARTEQRRSPEPEPERRPVEPRYAVQVGAFSERSKAAEQEKPFAKAGYKTEVREKREGRRKYYLVWVGEFMDRDQARAFADDLKRRFKARCHVVRRDD